MNQGGSDGHAPGLVIHPGHQELHGITVIVETTGPTTYVARYDREDERGIHFNDVAAVVATSGEELATWLERTRKFGVRAEQKRMTLPASEVRSIRQLGLA